MPLTTIYVTSDDILNGEASNCLKCPIALAIQRQIPCRFARVGKISVGLQIDLPDEAKKFIAAFDKHELNLQPFSFELELPNVV